MRDYKEKECKIEMDLESYLLFVLLELWNGLGTMVWLVFCKSCMVLVCIKQQFDVDSKYNPKISVHNVIDKEF